MCRNTLQIGFLFSGIEYLSQKTAHLKGENKLKNRFIDVLIAGISKTVAIGLSNPLYLLKTRAESGLIDSRNNIRQHIATIYRNEGLLGFYSGFSATLIRDVPYQAIQFGIYKVLGEATGAFGKPVDLELKKEVLGRPSLTQENRYSIRLGYTCLEASVQCWPAS